MVDQRTNKKLRQRPELIDCVCRSLDCTSTGLYFTVFALYKTTLYCCNLSLLHVTVLVLYIQFFLSFYNCVSVLTKTLLNYFVLSVYAREPSLTIIVLSSSFPMLRFHTLLAHHESEPWTQDTGSSFTFHHFTLQLFYCLEAHRLF